MTNETPEVQSAPPALPVADATATPPPTVGYCRACGLALTAATVRQSMGTLYCADHLPAAGSASAAGTPGATGGADSPYTSPYAIPSQPPVVNADVNPGLAFFLGLIPGVGAIYNAQYAKGLVHVILFGFVASLADSDTPLSNFAGFLIPIAIFYMAFEAFHTVACPWMSSRRLSRRTSGLRPSRRCLCFSSRLAFCSC
jgi:hypothetical protein